MGRFDDNFLMPGSIREDGTIEFPPDWTKEQRKAYLDRIREAAKRRRTRPDVDLAFEDSAVVVSTKL